MYKRSAVVLIIFVLMLSSSMVFAQSDECDPIQLGNALDDFADAIANASYEEIDTIAEDVNILLGDYLDRCAPARDTTPPTQAQFNVKATGSVNIRSCGDTSCGVVAVSTSGQTYSVIGQDGDWYEIDLGSGESGFIASWLTVRGPDEVIDIYEGLFNRDLMCGVQATVSRSRSNNFSGFAISGDGMNEVVVDIYRPNVTNPEPVWRQLPKTFIDSGDLYIHQIYRISYWPSGSYQVSLDRDGELIVYEFALDRTGETTIYVHCE